MKNFNVTSMLVMLMFMCITSMQAQSITPSKKKNKRLILS